MHEFYCDECNKLTSSKIVEVKQREYKVQGFELTLDISERKCNECNVGVSDEKLDSETLKKVFDKLNELKENAKNAN